MNIPCIDLTAITLERNVAMGENAQWLHAFNGAKWAEDGVTMIPTALDKTHTNSYGAKMNAWARLLIRKSSSGAAKFSTS